MHLFELLRPKEYTFRRQVELAAEPFQEEQKDSEEHLRKVRIELAEEQLVYMKEHNESLK